MLATCTFRPAVVVLIWSAAALTAFPTSPRVDPRAFLPSAIAATPTSDFLVLIVSPLASHVDPAC